MHDRKKERQLKHVRVVAKEVKRNWAAPDDPKELDEDVTGLSILVNDNSDEDNSDPIIKPKKGTALIADFASDGCFFLVSIINLVVSILILTNETRAAQGLSVSSDILQAVGLYFKKLSDTKVSEKRKSLSEKKVTGRSQSQRILKRRKKPLEPVYELPMEED